MISYLYLPFQTVAAAQARNIAYSVALGMGNTYWWPMTILIAPDSLGNIAYLQVYQNPPNGFPTTLQDGVTTTTFTPDEIASMLSALPAPAAITSGTNVLPVSSGGSTTSGVISGGSTYTSSGSPTTSSGTTVVTSGGFTYISGGGGGSTSGSGVTSGGSTYSGSATSGVSSGGPPLGTTTSGGQTAANMLLAQTQYNAVIAQGLNIASTSMPSINGVYSIDATAQANFTSTQVAILSGIVTFPMTWILQNGTPVSFQNSTVFLEVAGTIYKYVNDALLTQASIANGAVVSWASNEIIIP